MRVEDHMVKTKRLVHVRAIPMAAAGYIQLGLLELGQLERERQRRCECSSVRAVKCSGHFTSFEKQGRNGRLNGRRDRMAAGEGIQGWHGGQV